MGVKNIRITRCTCDVCGTETEKPIGNNWSTFEWYAGKERPMVNYEFIYGRMIDESKIITVLLCPDCTPVKKDKTFGQRILDLFKRRKR